MISSHSTVSKVKMLGDEEIGYILTSFSARLHHHSTSDSVKRVRCQTCYCSYTLGNHPADYDVHILRIRQHAYYHEKIAQR